MRLSRLLYLVGLTLFWLVARAECAASVKVLNLMYGGDFPNRVVDSLNAGIRASFAARKKELGGVADVSLTGPSSYNQSMESALDDALRESEGKLLLVVGPLGNDNVLWSRDKLKENDLVAFSPLSFSNEVRGWNPNFYFTSVEPNAELLALIRYVFVVMRLPRISSMYVKDTPFGESSQSFTVGVLSMMGFELSSVFVAEKTDSFRTRDRGASLNLKWEQFAKTNPQAVLLFGLPSEDTQEFIMRVVSDNRTSDAYMLTASNTQTFLQMSWEKALEAAGAKLRPGQLIITGTSPLPNDTRYRVIQRFRKEMDTYLKTNEDWGVFGKPEHFDDNHHNGELMVIGWLTAEVITRALIDSISLKKQTTFIESLYNQRRYLVDDIVIGDFGGNCTQGVAQQGATCQCNQGGSVVYMKEVVDGYRLEPLKEGFLTWGVAKCSSEDIRVHPPLSSLVLLMRDNDLANPVSQQYFTGISSLLGSERELEDERLFIRTINTTDAGASADMEGTRNDLVVSSILAVVNHDVLKIEGLVFVDPILTTPRLGKFRRNVIHIFPTLPQELYVIAQYLSKEAMGSVNVIIRSDEAADISALVSRTLLTFGVPLGSTFLMDINSTIPATYHKLKGDAIFIGLLPSDLNVVMDHLGKSPHARVFIAFTDVMFLYEGLRDAFQDERRKNLAERLVFATSLHHWGDKNTRSGNIAAYQKAVNDENLWSPVSLRGFLAAQFLETVISPMKKVNAELLSEEIFWQNSFVVEDMRYGPFNDESCAVDGLVISSNCARNYGATDISLWSFLRVLDPSVPVLQGAMTPSMEYKVISMQLTTEQTIGIAFGAVAAVLLLVVLGVSLVCTMRNSRDNDKAPKEATDPVTILFTDIESSTAQWAAYPEIMTEAVAMHHRTIRSLIRKHNCYEVKTIGDSFMIAGKSPSEAVQLAHDLQQAFFKCNWKTTQVDEFYRQCEEQRKVEGAVEGYEPPTARLDPDVYRELWNGLRVRVGIHTGLCDIRHDKVTKGYDYYGQTTNMAARTESVANGGQVLLTGATYLALTMEERRCLDVKPLGPVPLRGVPEPVEMYQLEAVPGRKFPALCLDREYYFEEEDMMTTSTSDNSSSRAELSESAQMIMSSLEMLLSTFNCTQREKILLPYCERWRVQIPRKKASEWDDDFCHEVVRRIAVKVGHVAEHCTTSASGRTRSTASSISTVIISGEAFFDLYRLDF